MPYIYVPSSALSSLQLGTRQQGNVPPSVGFGGLSKSRPDPRSRGRQRSQAEIETASREAYKQRRARLDELKAQVDARKEEERALNLARRQTRASDEYIRRFPERAAMEERARAENEAASARARMPAPRLSPAQQEERMQQIRQGRQDEAMRGIQSISQQFRHPGLAAPQSQIYGAPAQEQTASGIYGPAVPSEWEQSIAEHDAEARRQDEAFRQHYGPDWDLYTSDPAAYRAKREQAAREHQRISLIADQAMANARAVERGHTANLARQVGEQKPLGWPYAPFDPFSATDISNLFGGGE